jgi:hypothetical protein
MLIWELSLSQQARTTPIARRLLWKIQYTILLCALGVCILSRRDALSNAGFVGFASTSIVMPSWILTKTFPLYFDAQGLVSYKA